MTSKSNTTLFQDFQASLSANGVTPILMWDKPKKVHTVQEWKNHYGFEDGPDGGFIPNMSTSDQEKWKAKLVGTTTGYPQVEIRKSVGCQMTIIVSLGNGYNYKYYRSIVPEFVGKVPEDFPNPAYGKTYPNGALMYRGDKKYLYTKAELKEKAYPSETKGINVHLALNGPAQMTFDEMQEMNQAIAEAKTCLELLKKQVV